MDIKVATISIDFNYGLGVFPASIYIELKEEAPPRNIVDVYNEIIEYELPDVIFYGDASSLTSTETQWLFARLMASLVHVSVVFDLEKSLPKLIVNRFILRSGISYKNSRILVSVLKSLTKNDLVLLNPKLIKELSFIRAVLLKCGTKARSMFNSGLLSAKVVLDAGIYDIEPFQPNMIW